MEEAHGVTGKWRVPGVPQRGWSCLGITDLGEPSTVCEMCEVMVIRYVHHMDHAEYGPLDVGCVCAGRMEEDYEGARKREAGMKSRAARRTNWLLRRWRTSRSGNRFLNTDGFNVVAYPCGRGWGFLVSGTNGDSRQRKAAGYSTEDAARLAAFDAMLELK